MELLREAPKQMTRPLMLVDGRAYAATWLWVRTTITEEFDNHGEVVTLTPSRKSEGRMCFIVRDDGQLFGEVEDRRVKLLAELGLTVRRSLRIAACGQPRAWSDIAAAIGQIPSRSTARLWPLSITLWISSGPSPVRN